MKAIKKLMMPAASLALVVLFAAMSFAADRQGPGRARRTPARQAVRTDNNMAGRTRLSEDRSLQVRSKETTAVDRVRPLGERALGNPRPVAASAPVMKSSRKTIVREQPGTGRAKASAPAPKAAEIIGGASVTVGFGRTALSAHSQQSADRTHSKILERTSPAEKDPVKPRTATSLRRPDPPEHPLIITRKSSALPGAKVDLKRQRIERGRLEKPSAEPAKLVLPGASRTVSRDRASESFTAKALSRPEPTPPADSAKAAPAATAGKQPRLRRPDGLALTRSATVRPTLSTAQRTTREQTMHRKSATTLLRARSEAPLRPLEQHRDHDRVRHGDRDRRDRGDFWHHFGWWRPAWRPYYPVRHTVVLYPWWPSFRYYGCGGSISLGYCDDHWSIGFYYRKPCSYYYPSIVYYPSTVYYSAPIVERYYIYRQPSVTVVETYDAIDRLIDRLKYGDVEQRRKAALDLGEAESLRALYPLMYALEYDEDVLVRFYSAKSLGKLGSKDAIKALERAAAEDAEEIVRVEAADAVDRILET